jgi:hypothetical protein
VPNKVIKEAITCASCEYRYPRSVRICPICGTEPLQSLLAEKFSRARRELRLSSSHSQQKRLRPGLGRLIPALVVLIALMTVTSFFHRSYKANLPKESGSATELTTLSAQPNIENAGEKDIVRGPVGGVQHGVTMELGTIPTATSDRIKIENASERDIVHPPVRKVQHVVTEKVGTAQIIATKETGPAELWNAVKRGSVSAEVALANLYLEGEAVPKNCEQANMLLSAASIKGSKAADDLLKSSYAERCE